MAWVREKKPKRKQRIEDPIDRFGGALHFFAGRVPQVDRGRIIDHQRQLVKALDTPSGPIQHMMQARRAAVIAQQKAELQYLEHSRPKPARPKPKSHREDYAIVEYDEEEDDREQYEVRAREKPRQRTQEQHSSYHYQSDVSPERPRPRTTAPASNLRARTSRQHMSSYGSKAQPSRWASATASLPGLS